MVREVITINVGQCGIHLGDTVWKQYCKEHNINKNGSKTKEKNKDNSFLSFFEETGAAQYIPRNLMVDLEPNIIDNIKSSQYSAIYHREFLLSSKNDAAKNFARGHYSFGKDMIFCINDRLRKLVDHCDNVQGFVMNHSVGGGTGAGLGTLILERIAVDYRKKSKVGFEVYPFNNNHMLSNCAMEPYNALLTTHWLLDHTEVSFLFDNKRIYDLCQNDLNISFPTYNDMNLLICKLESSMTCSLRNEGELNVDLNEYNTSIMMPFPRLHFITASMAPIVNNLDVKKIYIKDTITELLVDGYVRCHYYYKNIKNENINMLQYEPPFYKELMNLIYCSYWNTSNTKQYHLNSNKKYYLLHSINDLLEMCCDPHYFMIEYDDYDPQKDKNMSVCVNFDGRNFKAKRINEAIQSLKKTNKIVFVEWCPNGFKCGLNNYSIPSIDGDTMASKETSRTITFFSNNTGISRFFENRIIYNW